MYAVIRAGGKQYKVAKGDVIEIEKVPEGDTVEFTPLMVVDEKGVTRSAKDDLAGIKVTATVIGNTQGPKVDIFRYKNKTGNRRHVGHRQRYTSVQISDIVIGGKKSSASKPEPKKEGSEATDGS